ncbi:MAG TPA: S9 family peptidase [Ktedonobacterales bacterium]|nr:S9 family peptidase [Ktedonobacterales bacterium]
MSQISAESQPSRVAATTERLLDIRQMGDVALTADGQRAAFVIYDWVPERQLPRGRLWMLEVDGGEPRPLATGNGEDGNPRWSPDGSRLAYISKREGEQQKPQLYQLSVEGGEARRVCLMPNGVEEVAWSPDGARIAVLSLEGDEPGKDPIVVGPDRHRRLWTVRPESDAPEPVTPPDVTVWEYAWSPDGSRLAVYYSTGSDETDWYRGQIGVMPVGGGAVRQIVRLDCQASALAWSPDGTRLAYVSGEWSDRGLVGGDVFVVAVSADAALAEARNLTPGIDFSPSWLQWFPDGQRLLYVGSSGTTNTIGILDTETGALAPLVADFIIGPAFQPRLAATPDLRRFVATHSDRLHPPDLWLGELPDVSPGTASITWRQLTRFNPILEETVRLAPAQKGSYEGADGWRIEALLTLPPEPKRGSPPPLVVDVHGGPTSAWRDDWRGGAFLVQVLAAAGFAVFQPNPRGSVGRGVAFTNAVLGDMGGKDFEDILRGIDYLVERGLVDGERVGIMGWSYGGFMTAWAVANSSRFKAALMGAGICDFHSFHGQTNIADWDMRFVGADPLENPDTYRARSAITTTRSVTTPTLILHGENDQCVPVNQAYAFYRALRERHVPTELAVYPREGHGVRERAHSVDLNQRALRWFETYL